MVDEEESSKAKVEERLVENVVEEAKNEKKDVIEMENEKLEICYQREKELDPQED